MRGSWKPKESFPQGQRGRWCPAAQGSVKTACPVVWPWGASEAPPSLAVSASHRTPRKVPLLPLTVRRAGPTAQQAQRVIADGTSGSRHHRLPRPGTLQKGSLPQTWAGPSAPAAPRHAGSLSLGWQPRAMAGERREQTSCQGQGSCGSTSRLPGLRMGGGFKRHLELFPSHLRNAHANTYAHTRVHAIAHRRVCLRVCAHGCRRVVGVHARSRCVHTRVYMHTCTHTQSRVPPGQGPPTPATGPRWSGRTFRLPRPPSLGGACQP